MARQWTQSNQKSRLPRSRFAGNLRWNNLRAGAHQTPARFQHRRTGRYYKHTPALDFKFWSACVDACDGWRLFLQRQRQWGAVVFERKDRRDDLRPAASEIRRLQLFAAVGRRQDLSYK